MNRKERIFNMLTVMEIMLDLLHGKSFESREDLEAFRKMVVALGYDSNIEDRPALNIFQQLCRDFAAIDLTKYQEDVN